MENKAIARIEQFAKKISESLWNESGTGRAAVMVGAGFSMNAVPLGDSKVVSRFFRKFISSASKYQHQMYGFSSSAGCSISILNRCSMSI